MITNVRIKKLNNETRLKFIASIVFDHVFAVHDIKVIEDEEKAFIAMPSKKIKDDQWVDICHPICQECRTVLENIILSCTKMTDASQFTIVDFVSKYENVPLLEQLPDDFEIVNEVK